MTRVTYQQIYKPNNELLRNTGEETVNHLFEAQRHHHSTETNNQRRANFLVKDSNKCLN